MTRIEPQAIRFTQAILTAQLNKLIDPDVGEIEIEFSQAEHQPPTQIMELLQLMRNYEKREKDSSAAANPVRPLG